MACAHAKFTGEVGVCMATSGPGAIHLLNGLYDAKLDHQPVVAIVGQQARMSLGGNYQQEVDLPSLFKDVAARVRRRSAWRRSRRATWSTARCGSRAPTRIGHLHDRPERRPGASRTRSRRASTAPCTPAPAARRRASCRATRTCSRAADVLNAGAKVAMLVGQGARGARGRGRAGGRRCSAPAWRRRSTDAPSLPDDAAVRHRLDRPARHEAARTT